jgi:hypothetical protein
MGSPAPFLWFSLLIPPRVNGIGPNGPPRHGAVRSGLGRVDALVWPRARGTDLYATD